MGVTYLSWIKYVTIVIIAVALPEILHESATIPEFHVHYFSKSANIFTENCKPMSQNEKIAQICEEYVCLLKSIDSYQKQRNASLDRMFWEYRNLNIEEFEDNETKYQKIVSDKHTYPSIFMASSLGFNKSTIQVKYIDFLQRFGLERRPQASSLRNALRFERLKHLIIKYFELLKK